MSLVFAKVEYEYKPQKADGSLDAGVFFKYDIKNSKVGQILNTPWLSLIARADSSPRRKP